MAIHKDRKTTKKEVFFIATRYKNHPASVDFFTKTGSHVPYEVVQKERTREGIRFYVTAPYPSHV